jgi:hypothetical protein
VRGLKQHKRLQQLREYTSECCFSGIPLGALGVGNPSRVIAPMARLNQVRRQAAGSSQMLVTFCDLSRSMCKPVYDLAGKPGQSNYHYSPQPVRMPTGPGLGYYMASSQPAVTDRTASMFAEAAQRFPEAENPMAAMMAEEMRKIMVTGAAEVTEGG